MKKPNRQKLIKKLDKVFGDWIKSKGDTCYTCHAKVEGKNKQAGHFISRSHHATRWDEDCVRIQCFRCNIWLGGNLHEFAARLLKEIGRKRFDALIQRGRMTKQWTVKDLELLIQKYEE